MSLYLWTHFSPKGLNERFGESLGALSMGRVGIIKLCVNFLKLSITIATRYSAVRKQFGPTPNEELPVLEYQVQVMNIFNMYHYFH